MLSPSCCSRFRSGVPHCGAARRFRTAVPYGGSSRQFHALAGEVDLVVRVAGEEDVVRRAQPLLNLVVQDRRQCRAHCRSGAPPRAPDLLALLGADQDEVAVGAGTRRARLPLPGAAASRTSPTCACACAWRRWAGPGATWAPSASSARSRARPCSGSPARRQRPWAWAPCSRGACWRTPRAS